MKEPWNVFADLYLEALRSSPHEMAVIQPIAAMIHDFQNRKQSVPADGIGHLKNAADRWHLGGSEDRVALREALKHAWTDWALEQNRHA
jgi:hypothetical protein